MLVQDVRDTQAPHIEMPTPTVTETSTSKPIVSQAYIESQMR